MQNVTIDRNKYTGGSDIRVIMGISPFKTRFRNLFIKKKRSYTCSIRKIITTKNRNL